MRKFTIKLIAILLLLLGVLSIIHSVTSFLFTLANKGQINLYISISMPFLFYAGFNLYQLKESGRKLTLVLFMIQVVANVGILIWVLLQKGERFQSWINFLDKKLAFAENRIMFTAIMLASSLVAALMMAFLSQPKTKELFSVEKNLSVPQSPVIQ